MRRPRSLRAGITAIAAGAAPTLASAVIAAGVLVVVGAHTTIGDTLASTTTQHHYVAPARSPWVLAERAGDRAAAGALAAISPISGHSGRDALRIRITRALRLADARLAERRRLELRARLAGALLIPAPAARASGG